MPIRVRRYGFEIQTLKVIIIGDSATGKWDELFLNICRKILIDECKFERLDSSDPNQEILL